MTKFRRRENNFERTLQNQSSGIGFGESMSDGLINISTVNNDSGLNNNSGLANLTKNGIANNTTSHNNKIDFKNKLQELLLNQLTTQSDGQQKHLVNTSLGDSVNSGLVNNGSMNNNSANNQINNISDTNITNLISQHLVGTNLVNLASSIAPTPACSGPTNNFTTPSSEMNSLVQINNSIQPGQVNIDHHSPIQQVQYVQKLVSDQLNLFIIGQLVQNCSIKRAVRRAGINLISANATNF